MPLGSSVRKLAVASAFLASACSDFTISSPERPADGAGEPDIAVEPTLLDLGAAPAGTVVDGSFTVRNDGTAPLTLAELRSDSPDLAVDPPAKDTVEPGESIGALLHLAVAGYDVDRVVDVLSDDPDEPDVAVHVVVHAELPDLVLDPVVLDLGAVQALYTATGEITLRNAGEAPLHVQAIAVDGADWSLVDGGAATLAPGEQTVATVQVAPTAAGDHPGELLVQSDDPAGVERAELLATSLAPALVVDPPSWDFGALEVGTQQDEAFELANEGEAPLTITSIDLVDPVFSLISVPALPLVLDPGASDVVSVRFTPVSPGAVAGEFTVQSDDPAGPTAVPLAGDAWIPAPDIDVTPVFYDFGQVGHRAVAGFAIANLGDAPLDVASVTVDGPYSLVFDPTGPPLVIAPGATVDFDTWFEPPALGIWPGTIAVVSDDPDEPEVDVALTGEGIPWTGDVATLDFDVQLQIADIAFVVDTTCSMGGLLTALTTEFQTISDEIAVDIPDVTFGVAAYQDYDAPNEGAGGDKPFELAQQQTTDVPTALTALTTLFAAGGGDTPESSMEALYQAATGNGYDLGCDGAYDSSTDVPPFVPLLGDAFGGTVPGAFIPGFSGDIGGMGFRDGVTPIFVLATDAAFRDPDDGDQTPGGCPQDAGEAATLAAIDALGGRVIVVGVGMANPLNEMSNLSAETGALGDLDGNGTDEPLAFGWSGASAAFRDGVVAAVGSLAENGGTYGEVHLEAHSDPLGLVSAITPSSYVDVASGTNLSFDVTVLGTVLDAPTADTSPVVLHLVGDGVVLESETLNVLP